MADHEDYLSGEAPMAHHESHEYLGSDEINVDGLSGELADNQPCISHDLGGAKHVADSLADLNSKVTDATLDDSGDPRDPNAHAASHQDGGTDEISIAGLAGIPTELTTHAGLPTVHQDAPQLILDHKGDASAHHAKYTDADARAVLSPLSIPPSAFFPYLDSYDWVSYANVLYNRSSLTVQYFFAPVLFPPGVTVTKITLYGYRDDGASALRLFLKRIDRVEGEAIMADCLSNWTDGHGSIYDDSIGTPIINNVDYAYVLELRLDPNDAVGDVKFTGAKIEFLG